jgi:sterol O-acyltransferase
MSSVHSSRAGQPTRPGRAGDGLTAPAPHPTTARPLAKAGGSTMFQTEQGTVRVQPYRAKGSKSLKALISFQPRESHFDLSGPGASDPFRGFFALFWIGLFLLFVQTAIKHYSRTGLLLSSEFAQLITADWRMLALTDAALILSSSLSVILVGGMRAGWWAYGNVVKTVQHVGQTAYLMAFVIWTVNWCACLAAHLLCSGSWPSTSLPTDRPTDSFRPRFCSHWYWVQSGFLVLHAMVMLMKVHSCRSPLPSTRVRARSWRSALTTTPCALATQDIAHNGHLANIALAKRQAEASLAKLLAANPGGREAALAEAHEGQLSAEAERRQLEREEARRAGLLIESANGSGIGPGSEVSTPGSESTLDLTTATTASPADDAHQHPHHLSEAALRQRLNVVSHLPSTPAASTSTTLAVSAASTSVSGPTSTKLQAALRPSAAHPLAFHPNDDIATTARNLDLYSAELTSTGAKRVTWPANVSVVNFIDYLLVPTLVYELEWPRTTKCVRNLLLARRKTPLSH